jgi:anti-sigma factor RsiW
MTTTITLREWEALSAYLDGQLNQKDRQRLERGLQERLELRQALEELRRTRAILRSQPKLRAPRNFTLTPEMVGFRTPTRAMPRAYPAFRLVSALASVLFILVLIGDFFGRAPVVTGGSPASGTVMQEMRAEAPAAASAASAAPDQAPSAAGLSQLQPKDSERAIETPTEEVPPLLANPNEGDPGMGIASAPEGETFAYSDASPSAVGSPTWSPAPGLLRTLEIGLAALALLAGLIAMAFRSSAR